MYTKSNSSIFMKVTHDVPEDSHICTFYSLVLISNTEDHNHMLHCGNITRRSHSGNELTKRSSFSVLRRKILIADATALNRLAIKMFMSSYCMDFDEVGNGYDALQYFKISSEGGNEYSAIFMNSELPMVDGKSTSGLIKEYEVRYMIPHTPIVGVGDKVVNLKPNWCDIYFTTPLKLKDMTLISNFLKFK
jgi:hypothetical protein